MHEYTSLKRLNVSVKNPNSEATADDRWLPLGLLGADLDYIGNLIVNKGTLPNNSDLDSINTNSVYFLSDNNTYSHMPADMSTYGFITTKITGVIIQQIIETDDSIYIRRFNATNWSTWVKK